MLLMILKVVIQVEQILVFNHTKTVDANSTVHTNVYATHYNFELFSNFTFFLEDPENGDQIRQFEDRILIGAHTHFKNNSAKIGNTNFPYKTGAGFRFDQVNDNELSRTKNRVELLERLAFGDVDETNMFGYAEARFDTGKFSFNPVLRLDYFKFDYVDKLSEVYSNRSESKVAFSPKFNTIFNASKNTQLFLKTGIGFHSNDTRVVVDNNGEQILPAAYGLDLGAIVKPTDNMVINATVWSLFLDQEFVYVGDAGIVEPSGKTRRYGMELGVRYQPKDWFYLYADANLTNARSTENTDGQDFIPLAPDFTSVGGFTFDLKNGFSGGLNYRYIDDRPANEDNSIVAEDYFVNDANFNYTKGNWRFSLIVENLFDVEWNETQFATESRLLNEADSFEEIHFTPGTPFFLRGKVTLTL